LAAGNGVEAAEEERADETGAMVGASVEREIEREVREGDLARVEGELVCVGKAIDAEGPAGEKPVDVVVSRSRETRRTERFGLPGGDWQGEEERGRGRLTPR
jgi:hypothetical protein